MITLVEKDLECLLGFPFVNIAVNMALLHG